MRKVSFYIITFLVPFLLVGFIELAFYVFNIAEEVPIFIESEIDKRYLKLNPNIAERYFKSSLISVRGENDSFLKTKSESTLRIVIQGESSIQGFPYGHSISAPRILKSYLKKIYPSYKVEVINLGITAISSYVIKDMAYEVAKLEPDYVIIYAGHNEFYGAYGSATSEYATTNENITALFFFLKRFRVFRFISSFIAGSEVEEFDATKTLMEKMAYDKKIELDSEIYSTTIERFTSNIKDISNIYKRNSIPFAISTLAINLKDQPPFLSENLTIEKLYEYIDLIKEDSVSNEVVSELEKLEKAYPTNALLYYLLGKSNLQLGNTNAAEKYFILSLQHDALRFRAPLELNNRLVELANSENIDLIDVYNTFKIHSNAGIIGNELILEHIHPNILGYSILAYCFLENILGSGFLPNINSSKELYLDEDFLNIYSNYINPLDSIIGTVTVNALLRNWPFNLYDSLFSPPPLKYEASVELDLAVDVTSNLISHYDASLILCRNYMLENEYINMLRVANALSLEWNNRPRIQIYQFIALAKLQKIADAKEIFCYLVHSLGREVVIKELKSVIEGTEIGFESFESFIND
ncbi:hypothetical protein [Peijinzhouia sedimentorum]